MGWYIVLGILIFLILILTIPVHVIIKYDEHAELDIRYLFISYQLIPGKKESGKKESRKKEEPEKTGKPAGMKKTSARPHKKEMKPLDFLYEIENFFDRYARGVGIILRNFRIHDFTGFWKVTGEDAADCAIRYGRICAVLGGIMSYLNNIIKTEKIRLRVFPDFVGEEDVVRASADFQFNPIVALYGLIVIAVQYISGKSDREKNRHRKNGNSEYKNNNDSAAKECA